MNKVFLRKAAFIIGIFLVFNSYSTKAQQIPFYTHYYINPFIYNPALAGVTNAWSTFLIHHSQWSGFPGAPVTTALTIDGPLKSKKIGVGINLMSDVTGITTRLGANSAYSYRVDFDSDNRLFFGLSLGIISNQIDFSKQEVRDVGEATIIGNFDERTSFDASFGMSYNWKDLELGFAVPQIMNTSAEYLSITESRSYYNFARHYLSSVKYVFNVNKEKDITAYPLVLVRAMPGIPVQYDINGVLNWQKYGWFGVSYKSEYAVTLNLGIRYNGLSFGYAYDLITSPIKDFTGPSSEFILGYAFAPRVEKNYDDKIDLIAKKVQVLEERKPDSLQAFNKNIVPEVGSLYLLEDVNFATKSYELTKGSKAKLGDLIEFLNDNPTVKIQIQGHTDDVGTHENNDILSLNRAKSVLDHLISKGISEDRLTIKSFGESRPRMLGTTAKARAINRRTEILILEK